MIISHEHRYLFIENPLTASWAIHVELCDRCGGEAILPNNANHLAFPRRITTEGKIACVCQFEKSPRKER
jgi:hypothetical protein